MFRSVTITLSLILFSLISGCGPNTLLHLRHLSYTLAVIVYFQKPAAFWRQVALFVLFVLYFFMKFQLTILD